SVHSRNNVNHQNQFVPQAVLLRTGKVNIPPARPQPVPTSKPKVPAPVPTGRQNRPFPVPTDRGYSPSVTSGWRKSTARLMPHLNRPISSYFQTYTPYVPQMYNNHIKYGGLRWANDVKSSAGNMERLDDFQEFQGGKVTFGGDSECDEQVIIVPSYPSHNIQDVELKDTSGDEVDDSPLDSAKEIFQQELARLKGQEQRATSDAQNAEELQKRASTKTVPPVCIPVPTGSILVPSGDTTISPGDVPVPPGSPTDSLFDDERTTRFP
ncbi:hypothetical protein Tco_0020710, partial [Tanacetum coccineum]